MRKLAICLVLASLIFGSLALSETITLTPGESKSFSNPLGFSVTASCTVTGAGNVKGSLTSGSATINGVTYNSGDSTTLSLTNGEIVSISASGDAAVDFTDEATENITLDCDVNL
jgi:hypothetical protein